MAGYGHFPGIGKNRDTPLIPRNQSAVPMLSSVGTLSAASAPGLHLTPRRAGAPSPAITRILVPHVRIKALWLSAKSLIVSHYEFTQAISYSD
jgi:hypothetical protein